MTSTALRGAQAAHRAAHDLPVVAQQQREEAERVGQLCAADSARARARVRAAAGPVTAADRPSVAVPPRQR